jgi:hypothetical protein
MQTHCATSGSPDVESVVYGDPQDRIRGYDPDWWRRDKCAATDSTLCEL